MTQVHHYGNRGVSSNGSLIGRSEGGISNNYEFGFIDIVLGTAAQKVGGFLGGGSVDVKAEFSDE